MTAVLTEGVAGSVDAEVSRERYAWGDDSSVLLPVVGELVRVARRTSGGVVEGRWLGLVRSPDCSAGVTARLLVSGDGVVLVPARADRMGHEETVLSAAPACEPGEALRALWAELERAADVARAHEVFVDRLTEAAHEEADSREWCSDFDDFMERMGLARRSQSYRVEVTVSATVYVDACSESDARDEISAELIAQVLGAPADGGWDFDIGEVYGN